MSHGTYTVVFWSACGGRSDSWTIEGMESVVDAVKKAEEVFAETPRDWGAARYQAFRSTVDGKRAKGAETHTGELPCRS